MPTTQTRKSARSHRAVRGSHRKGAGSERPGPLPCLAPQRRPPTRGQTGGAGGTLLVNCLKDAARIRGESRKLTPADRRSHETPTSPERCALPEATGGPRMLSRWSHGALDTQHRSCRPLGGRVRTPAESSPVLRRACWGSARRSAPPGRHRQGAGPSTPLSQGTGAGPGPPPGGTVPTARTQTTREGPGSPD